MSPARPRPAKSTAPSLRLPILGKGKTRRKYARWRALTLSLVYVLFAVHIVHWKLHGKTLAPLELNEVMYTLELGIVTAGFLFMAALVVGTLLFGRFFCSWACHMMVLQDLCAWILRKLRVSPKPIRSRVLLLIPPLTAFYMFLWPQIVRGWHNRALPTFHLATDRDGWASFVTDNFWRNLPSPAIIALTFVVCGFFIVYLLGSRSFCTYVCPYGAIFGLADRFAPTRIRLTGRCQQCGRCTAACTSDVRVHEELNRFAMVVNPACLKDLDCVSVCPQEAIHVGWGKPALFKSITSGGRFGLPYSFSAREDALMALVAVAVLLAFRGLYSRVPFLLSLAWGAIVAYLAVLAVRLVTRPAVRLVGIQLKERGRIFLTGRVFAALVVLLAVFVVHSGFVRFHEYSGLRLAQRVLSRNDGAAKKPTDKESAQHAFEHLATADRWGLMDNERVERSLLAVALRLERYEAMNRYAVRLLARHPDDAQVRLQLGEALAAQDRPAEAERQFRTIIKRWTNQTHRPVPVLVSAHQALATMLAQRSAYPTAVDELRTALSLDPSRAAVHAELGSVLAELGQLEEAVVTLREAVRLAPDLGRAQYNLGTLLAHQGHFEEAIGCYRRALTTIDGDADLHNNLGFALLRTGQIDEAEKQLERAIAINPRHAGAHFNLASTLEHKHDTNGARFHLRTAARLDARYARFLRRLPPE